MEHDRIIGKTDKPMDWVNSLVIVEKKDGSLRLCLDPKDLNSVIRHGNFQFPSFEDVVSCLEGRNISQSWTKGTPTGNYPWVKKALTYTPLILLWPIPLPMYATWNLLCIWGAVEENIWSVWRHARSRSHCRQHDHRWGYWGGAWSPVEKCDARGKKAKCEVQSQKDLV